MKIVPKTKLHLGIGGIPAYSCMICDFQVKVRQPTYSRRHITTLVVNNVFFSPSVAFETVPGRDHQRCTLMGWASNDARHLIHLQGVDEPQKRDGIVQGTAGHLIFWLSNLDFLIISAQFSTMAMKYNEFLADF